MSVLLAASAGPAILIAVGGSATLALIPDSEGRHQAMLILLLGPPMIGAPVGLILTIVTIMAFKKRLLGGWRR
jgi:hypothetical protein